MAGLLAVFFSVGRFQGPKVHMIICPKDQMIIGPIFDFVFGSNMDHFWDPKCAQMRPNGDKKMKFHNDLTKIQFGVVACPILGSNNPRK